MAKASPSSWCGLKTGPVLTVWRLPFVRFLIPFRLLSDCHYDCWLTARQLLNDRVLIASRSALFLPVGFFAVADADDFDGVVAGFAIDEAPGADAEAEQWRVEAFMLLDVSRLGLHKAVQRF